MALPRAHAVVRGRQRRRAGSTSWRSDSDPVAPVASTTPGSSLPCAHLRRLLRLQGRSQRRSHAFGLVASARAPPVPSKTGWSSFWPALDRHRRAVRPRAPSPTGCRSGRSGPLGLPMARLDARAVGRQRRGPRRDVRHGARGHRGVAPPRRAARRRAAAGRPRSPEQQRRLRQRRPDGGRAARARATSCAAASGWASPSPTRIPRACARSLPGWRGRADAACGGRAGARRGRRPVRRPPGRDRHGKRGPRGRDPSPGAGAAARSWP